MHTTLAFHQCPHSGNRAHYRFTPPVTFSIFAAYLLSEHMAIRFRDLPKEEQEKRIQQAKELYLYTQKTQAEIGRLLGVSHATVGVWKNRFKWHKEKEQAENVAYKLQKIYCNLVDKIEKLTTPNEDEDSPEWDFDALSKAVSALEKFEQKRNASGHIEKVGLLLARYLTEQMPEKRNEYIGFYRGFAEWYLLQLND